METFRLTIFILTIILSIANLLLFYKYDLQMLQQNSYRNQRYIKWIRNSDETSRMQRLIAMAVLAMLCAYWFTWTQIIASAVLICMITSMLRKKYKKPLVYTKRVWRLIVGCVVLSCGIAVIFASFNIDYLSRILLAMAAVSYAIVIIVNWALKPVENAINQSYIDDAKKRLAQMPDMKIIGITGSYGKTSTKHYLNRILNEQFNVLMTPGSFNTPMGVVRTVRELMEPYHDIFIVEMGAKNIGDIKEICDIVHPEIGILTSVGAQHLESFKTIENVQRTKFELIDALPNDGLAVLNDDFEYVANREVDNVKAIRYAIKTDLNADYTATDIKYSTSGTSFTMVNLKSGTRLDIRTKLLGESNISNLMAAIIVAKHLGMSDEKIQYAASKIEQVEHRLSMKHTPGKVTIIDDAFNSNPVGSSMALDVLKMIDSGKRIIITPGMIELGEKQVEYNTEFGKKIATSCDVAIVVGEYNRDAIVNGFNSATKNGNPPELHIVESFTAAQQLLHTMLQPGDIVLYENDLPDTFK